MDLSKYRTSKELTEEGVTIDLGDGLKVRLARIGNKKYNEALRRLTKPYQNAIRNKTISDEVMERIVLEAFVGNVLISWSGLTLDGADVPYSREKAIEILSNPEYVDFRNNLEALASEMESFRAAEVAATVEK